MSSFRLPRWLSGKESTCQSRTHRRCGFDSWVGKIPGGGNGNPFQSSCLENLMDRGAWQVAVHGVTELDTTEHTSMCTHTYENMTEHASLCAHRSCIVIQDFPAGPGVKNLPSNAGMGVWSLVSKLKSHMLWGKCVWVFQQEMSAYYN